jgi:hypothetical protein
MLQSAMQFGFSDISCTVTNSQFFGALSTFPELGLYFHLHATSQQV